MKRRYSVKHLQTLQEHVVKARSDVRMLLKIHQSDVRSLNTPEALKRYKPEYRLSLIEQAKQESVKHLRHLGENVLALVRPALQERGLHARETYLREAGFRDEVPDLADKHEQALRQTLADLSAGIKQLSYVNRLQRLPDEQLLTLAEQAVRSGDVGLAGLCLEEAGVRKNSMLALKVTGMVDQIAVPEAEAAAAFFALTEDVLSEYAETERVILEPNSQFAPVALKSRQINEEKAARELVEQAEAARVKKEAAEQKEREAKARLDAFMKKAKDLPVEKPSAPVIELTEPPDKAA